MAASQKTFAEALGVPTDQIEGEIKIRRPDDPEKTRRDHEKDLLRLKVTGWLAGVALALTFALCWLFLHYGRPEQAEKVVSLIVGLVSGIVIGRSTSGKE